MFGLILLHDLQPNLSGFHHCWASGPVVLPALQQLQRTWQHVKAACFWETGKRLEQPHAWWWGKEGLLTETDWWMRGCGRGWERWNGKGGMGVDWGVMEAGECGTQCGKHVLDHILSYSSWHAFSSPQTHAS